MSTKPLRILVVEDDDDTRRTLVRTLASLGHWVESCPDAETALSRMSHDGLDVLLTNAYLPGAKGLDYLYELSQQGKLPPRVISMSESADQEECRRSKLSGCAGHLIKPFTGKTLKAVLN